MKYYPFVGTLIFTLWDVVAKCTSDGVMSLLDVVVGSVLTVDANAVNNPIEKSAIIVIFNVFISSNVLGCY